MSVRPCVSVLVFVCTCLCLFLCEFSIETAASINMELFLAVFLCNIFNRVDSNY